MQELIKIYRLLLHARLLMDWLIVINPYDYPWYYLRVLTQPLLIVSRLVVPTRGGTIFGIDFSIIIAIRILKLFERFLFRAKGELVMAIIETPI